MPFEKGKSGNPGGRPKEMAGLAEAIRKEFEADIAKGGIHEAIKRGFDLIRFSPEPKDKLAALKLMLEYGYGKPTQPMEFSGEDGPLKIVVVTGVPDPEPKGGDGPDHPA